MKYEVIETCANCERDNIMEWNVKEDGYVAFCSHCGNKMMLCDECLHAEDNPNMKCDWHNDAEMGLCFRDTRPITLEYLRNYQFVEFSVPRNWFWNVIRQPGYSYNSLKTFFKEAPLMVYQEIYDKACKEGMLICNHC